MRDYKELFERYSSFDRDSLIEELGNDSSVLRDEKYLVLRYYYPRPLLHMELPSRIMESRGSDVAGYLDVNLMETSLLLEAYRTPQYMRYMKHLLYSYDVSDKIFPMLGEDICECGLCKKSIYQVGRWKSIYSGTLEESSKQYLSFGSTDSNIVLCINCLTQLKKVEEILNSLEPDRLKYVKRGR